MSRMSRINSLLSRVMLLTGLCTGVLSFAHGAAFAQAVANPVIANVVQPPPPRALIEPQQAPAPAAAPTALSGPEQRVALVIGNSNYRNAPQLAPTTTRSRWRSFSIPRASRSSRQLTSRRTT